MAKVRLFHGARRPAGAEPLAPQKKWRAILVSTLLLVLAYWSMLAGLVSIASDSDDPGGPNAAAALAFGLALIPFVFVVLAFMSEHPRAPNAVVKAMGLSLLVGIPVSAVAGDAVTGIVAGIGAGGIAALRADGPENWKARAIAVVIGSAYTFVLVRMVGELALLPAPIFPFTGLGMADHYTVWRESREPSSG
ncbi:MAG: hypothetical protein ACRD2C_05080 [Acidimicrobiales bacterium]